MSSSLFEPADGSLWRAKVQLEADAELEWSGAHGDEAIYLLSGSVQVGGSTLSGEGAVIIEAGARATVRALSPAVLLHFGPKLVEPAAAAPAGPAAPPATSRALLPAATRIVTHDAVGLTVRYYRDGTHPACQLMFFTVSSDQPLVSSSHLHSEDEIIHVLEGEIRVGPQRVPAGASVAIPAERRYGFRTDGPIRFINYRRKLATTVREPGSEAVLDSHPAAAG